MTESMKTYRLEPVGPSSLSPPERLVTRLNVLGDLCVFPQDSSARLRKVSSSGHAVVNFCDIVQFLWTLTINHLAKIKELKISGIGILSVFLNEEDI